MTNPGATSAHGAARFGRARTVVFGIVLASFVLSFFHRTAPAAIAGELTRAFAINAAMLGTLAATYFYVYTLLQIPVGVAGRHAGAAPHPVRRLAASRAPGRSRSRSRRRGRSRRRAARWSASACRWRSSRSSRSAPSGSRPTASRRSTASRCSPATPAPSSPARRSRGSSRRRRGATCSSGWPCCRSRSASRRGARCATGRRTWDSRP